MRFGMGVDSVLQEAKGDAIKFTEEVTGKPGQEIKASFLMIESQEQLMEEMNLSISVSARYLAAEGSAKMKLAQSSAVNEYSSYVLVKAIVKNSPRYMESIRLTDPAKEAYLNDPNQFVLAYGDTYIDEIYGGGEMFGLLTFNCRDESSKQSLQADLRVSVNAGFAGGSLDASFTDCVKKHSRTSELSINCWLSGGKGLVNPSNLGELTKLYKDFNASAAENPVDYRVTLKPYGALLPPGKPWASQEVRRDTMESCGSLVVRALQLRSRIDYVLGNRNQFEPFGEEDLRKARAANEKLLPAVAARAEACSADVTQCSLDGIEPVMIDLPKRKVTVNPLATKWDEVLKLDAVKDFFSPTYLPGTSIEDVQPCGDGRFKLFFDKLKPVSGIFWHPRVGPNAFVVYGPIFAEYEKRGHCEGAFGFPTGDIFIMPWGAPSGGVLVPEATGKDLICYFENKKVLWWEAATNKVSDNDPNPIKVVVQRPSIPELGPTILTPSQEGPKIFGPRRGR